MHAIVGLTYAVVFPGFVYVRVLDSRARLIDLGYCRFPAPGVRACSRPWLKRTSWQEMFLKAQIAVSEVLGRQRLNTAVFCTRVACTKRELRAAIFETGERPILWQEQF